MPRSRPARLQRLAGIGVDRMGDVGDSNAITGDSLLRLENLDINVPPDTAAVDITASSIIDDDCNSYLPFIGQLELRDTAAKHVMAMTYGKVHYEGQKNCVISTGGLNGILNVLLATVEDGDGVVMTDPTYVGLINRVKLSGGVPRLAPFKFEIGKEWKLDLEALRRVVEAPENNVTCMLLMSPSLPSGGYLDAADWKVVTELCVKHDLLLIYNAAMERLLFDGRQVVHPASFPGMSERTITVGSASKELRMIGWRVGWIVGPEAMMSDIAKVGMANVVVPVGIAQRAASKALEASSATIEHWSEELQKRRDVIMAELNGLPFGAPAGGLSLCFRTSDFGLSGEEASKKLLREGVCVTAMTGWGEEHGTQYVRLVYSNESVERLKGLGKKFRDALGIEK